jgi:hypothetical protein
VILEVGLLAEASRTDGATVGPGPRVHVHVRFQVARRGKGFCAQGALVRLFLQTEENVLKFVQSSKFELLFNFIVVLDREKVVKEEIAEI